jgi:prepilin-type N-terminal cleavage/methylation domain-containing protein
MVARPFKAGKSGRLSLRRSATLEASPDGADRVALRRENISLFANPALKGLATIRASLCDARGRGITLGVLANPALKGLATIRASLCDARGRGITLGVLANPALKGRATIAASLCDAILAVGEKTVSVRPVYGPSSRRPGPAFTPGNTEPTNLLNPVHGVSRCPALANCRRRAFTLVEMLVVFVLMLILAALAVAFVPKMTERAKNIRGASSVQGWLAVSRQWAKRDGVPTGIRILPGTLYPNAATPNTSFRSELQYIQQPDPFYAGQGTAVTITPALTGATATISSPSSGNVDFSNGGQTDNSGWIALAGDYLEVQRSQVYQITSITRSGVTTGPYDTLNLSSAPTSTILATDYHVFRSPRVLAGETTLSMPQDTIIDTSTNTKYGQTLPSSNAVTGAVDILFSPNGGLLPTSGVLSDKLVLWVRDVTDDNVQAGHSLSGDQTLIVVNSRTGLVSAQPVDSTVNTVASSAPAGTNVNIQVADVTDIYPGNFLIIAASGGGTYETVYVTNVTGNIVTLSQVVNTYVGAVQVISDPYSFARNGTGSGL